MNIKINYTFDFVQLLISQKLQKICTFHTTNNHKPSLELSVCSSVSLSRSYLDFRVPQHPIVSRVGAANVVRSCNGPRGTDQKLAHRVPKKKHVTTFSTITLTISVRLQ